MSETIEHNEFLIDLIDQQKGTIYATEDMNIFSVVCSADDLKALVAQLKWIPVSDPPKKDGEYLTRYGSAVEILDYIGGIWYDGNGNEVVFGSPELWMPIPPYTAERGEDGEL